MSAGNTSTWVVVVSIGVAEEPPHPDAIIKTPKALTTLSNFFKN